MKGNRLLTVTVAVLGAVWGLADELDDLFPKSNKVVAEGGGVKITSSELDATVMFALMNLKPEINVLANSACLIIHKISLLYIFYKSWLISCSMI